MQKAIATVYIPESWTTSAEYNSSIKFEQVKKEATDLLATRMQRDNMEVKQITSLVYEGAIWTGYFLVREE